MTEENTYGRSGGLATEWKNRRRGASDDTNRNAAENRTSETISDHTAFACYGFYSCQ